MTYWFSSITDVDPRSRESGGVETEKKPPQNSPVYTTGFFHHIPDLSPACFATSCQVFFFMFLVFKILQDLSFNTGKSLTASTNFSSMPAVCLSRQTVEEPGLVYCDWLVLLLLLPTPTIWFSLNRKRRSRKRSQK